MSVSIKYKGTEIASASTEVTKTIKTAGKYCEADILVENTPDGGDAPVINPLSVTANGTYTAPAGVDGYSPVTVNVPQGITPTGNINITDTNVTDVTNYATAQVVSENLTAENIKKNVNILGVVGTFEGGGGGLPSSISKIDGGSFTVASDTNGSSYPIAHNLGIIPKCYAIWTDDNDAFEASANNTLIHAFGYIGDAYYTASAKDGGYRAHYTRNANGSTATFASSFRNDEKGSYATETVIYWGSTNKYKAGCTYKWIAWA